MSDKNTNMGRGVVNISSPMRGISVQIEENNMNKPEVSSELNRLSGGAKAWGVKHLTVLLEHLLEVEEYYQHQPANAYRDGNLQREINECKDALDNGWKHPTHTPKSMKALTMVEPIDKNFKPKEPVRHKSGGSNKPLKPIVVPGFPDGYFDEEENLVYWEFNLNVRREYLLTAEEYDIPRVKRWIKKAENKVRKYSVNTSCMSA